MADRINFTMAALAKLKPASVRRYVYDSKVPGLAVSITPNGKVIFYLIKKIQRRTERIRLGGFPEITVETARELATDHNANIAKGDNPADSKRRLRGELTMGQLWALYLEFHAIPRKKPSSVDTDRSMWERYMGGWTGRRLSTIENSDIQTLHSKIGKAHGKYAANRLLSLLSTMFNVAAAKGEWRFQNPCKWVKPYTEKSRDRFLQPTELPQFLAALKAEPNQQAADAFRLMLWTGARKANVLAMRWSEVDLQSSTWRIPDTKANEPQLVHLPDEAVAVLAGIKKASKEPTEFVFPARTAGSATGHLSDITKPWKSVCEAAGIEDLRMHDLRRTLGSWQAADGTSLQLIGKTLGHKDIKTTQIYSRLNIDPVRESVNRAVAAMNAAGAVENPKNINKNDSETLTCSPFLDPFGMLDFC